MRSLLSLEEGDITHARTNADASIAIFFGFSWVSPYALVVNWAGISRHHRIAQFDVADLDVAPQGLAISFSLAVSGSLWILG